MTERDEKELLESIERVLAGEDAAIPEGVSGIEELVELSRLLARQKAEPSAEFEQELSERLSRIRESGPGAPEARAQRRWVPFWITWRRAAAVAATLVLGLGVAGMTNAVIQGTGPFRDGDGVIAGEDRDTRDTGADKTEALRDGTGAAGSADGTATPYTGEAEIAGDPAVDGTVTLPELRRVVQSADYEIEVPVGEFQNRFDEISDLAARYGGYVISADSSVSDGGEDQLKQGTITIRVANVDDNFGRAQRDIEALGKVVSKQVSGEDVTEEYVDLQSRLRNAEAQQASLLALMQKAETVDEILMVQSRLDEVQMEIEQLKGRIQYVETMTDNATITVEIREEDVEADGRDEDDGTDWGFVESIRYAGWLAVQTVNFVIIALGILIPALVIISLVTLVAYRLVQRRRRKADGTD